MKHVTSPVRLDLQEERKVWSKYGLLGPVYGTKGYLNDKRFIANPNDLSTVNSKYMSYKPQSFPQGEFSLDEFIKNESSAADENANNQTYFPKVDLLYRNEMRGIPDFGRYAGRATELNPVNLQPNLDKSRYFDCSVTTEALERGKEMTMRSSPQPAPFKNLMGRDKLYERMHGLPKMTKEEAIKKAKEDKEYVSAQKFMPNSVTRSPKCSSYSQSTRTKRIGLFNMDDHISIPQSLNLSFKNASPRASLNTSPAVTNKRLDETNPDFSNNSPYCKLTSRNPSYAGRFTELGHHAHDVSQQVIDYDSIFKFTIKDSDMYSGQNVRFGLPAQITTQRSSPHE